MAMQSKKAYLERCSCGSCRTGCCIPIDHSNPIYEPWGTPKNIPFTITAPNCAQIDGYSSELFCGGAVPVRNKGVCGPCLSCIGGGPDDGGWNLLASRRIEFPLPMGCVTDSCSIVMCIHLECRDSTAKNQLVAECCQKFRMLLGINAGTLAHINGEDPSIEVPGAVCDSWRRVLPDSCECGETEEDMPAIVFPLGFSVTCDEYYTGTCAGFSKCCDNLINCDLSDAYLVI